MKLLFEEAKLNAKHDSTEFILSFFFLARGTVEEKSTAGLYRSLLHQLFEKAGDLGDSLEWMTVDGARGIQRSGWHEEALKQTLTHAVEKLGNRQLTIFVDALDECDKNQVADMVGFFEDLCDRAKEKEVRLKICFSSRHYPTVVIQRGIEVTLEDEVGHTEDIKQYIKSKLRLGKSKQAEILRSEILEKSSRIFLWVVLVLDILNSEYPHSAISLKKIRERLKEIPPKLNDLFEMILVRDGEHLEQLHACLKWILFAARPLKPQELYFAIHFALDKDCSGYWDEDDMELEQMKTFVRSSSKGLAEVTRNKASEVQFIHESVRDFLRGRYQDQWFRESDNLAGHSHELLRDCCLSQLKSSINSYINVPDPLPAASKSLELGKTIRLKFPFLEYSILNILHHANSAQQNSMDQEESLVKFPLQRWIFFNNALERYEVRRYTKSTSLLYILAEKNLADLIHIHPQRSSFFEVESGRYGLPLLAALALGNHEAVLEFLQIEAEMQPQVPVLRYLCKEYSDDETRRASPGRDFTFSHNRNIFHEVARAANWTITAFLIYSGKVVILDDLDVEIRDRNGYTPLMLAAQNGDEQMVDFFLEKGADIESKDSRYGQTPLSDAADKGHEATVKLLLEKRC